MQLSRAVSSPFDFNGKCTLKFAKPNGNANYGSAIIQKSRQVFKQLENFFFLLLIRLLICVLKGCCSVLLSQAPGCCLKWPKTCTHSRFRNCMELHGTMVGHFALSMAKWETTLWQITGGKILHHFVHFCELQNWETLDTKRN